MAKVSRGIKQYDKIKVNWIDIVQSSGWTDLDEIKTKQPAIVASLGFFFFEDDEKVVIIDCMSELEGNNQGSYTIFPKGCITSIIKLKSEE